MSSHIDKLLGALKLEEKCFLVAGKNMWETQDVPRLGIGSIKTTDGPAGVRGATWTDGTHTTYMPCGISLAATFDAELVERVGRVLGAETRSKGAHVLLAPTMNMSRSPLGGRNFENFGEDPLLTGVMAAHYIRGVQATGQDGEEDGREGGREGDGKDEKNGKNGKNEKNGKQQKAAARNRGVGACMKHYVANDMETRRFNMDEAIDARTLHEVYLRPFAHVLRRPDTTPWTAMAAYPKINGAHADCSVPLLEDVLRRAWGFEGLVMSDWGGLNDTVQSLVAGTDLEMPGPAVRYGQPLLAAVRQGRVSEAQLDKSVRRLLCLLDRAGALEGSGRETKEDEKKEAAQPAERDSDLPAFRQTARDAAAGGIVLLKNEGGVLPLEAGEGSRLRRLAVIGPNAAKPTTGGSGSASVNPYYVTTPLEALTEAVRTASGGDAVEVVHAPGVLTSLQPRVLAGEELLLPRQPDGSSGGGSGVQVDFYAGHAFGGPVVASSRWPSAALFMMSDGDTPTSLRGRPHCYRVRGIVRPAVSATYDISLAQTGQARLYLDGRLVIDNTGWTTPGGSFMNCGSANRLAALDLQAGRDYALRVDNVVVPPPLPPHDNTLFHTLSGLRVGLQARIDEDALLAAAVDAARSADAVVLVVGHNNDTEKEGVDRTSLALPRRTDEMVLAVADALRATAAPLVVVVQSACAVAMPWAGHVTAIVQAWYQGQENGNALADVLLGRASPSGRLPVTFPRRLADHGSGPWFPGDAAADRASYGEGVLVGYRWFDARAIEPLWPFGFGLSYSSFRLDGVAVSGSISAAGATATVSATLSNTGRRDAAHVVQAYLASSPAIAAAGLDSAPRSLAAFAKVFVPAGASRPVTLILDHHAVEWFDVGAADHHDPHSIGGAWRVDPGVYACYVGSSSRHFDAEVSVVVE